MLKYCKQQWDKRSYVLLGELEQLTDEQVQELTYKQLLQITVDCVLNGYYEYNSSRITQVDDGDYSGTLMFLIPEDGYEISEDEYLMTYVRYGSCSGCDTLKMIQSCMYNDDKELRAIGIRDLMALCKDLVTNIVKPYNTGWRESDDFEVAEV